MSGNRTLGIIAGGGTLPAQLVSAAGAEGRKTFVIALEGFCDVSALPAGTVHETLPLGAASRMIAALRAADADEVVLAGQVRRPGLMELKPDIKALAVLTRASLKGLGDDGLLGLVREALEGEGFRLIGAADVLPALLAGEGLLAGKEPDEQAMADIQRGRAVLDSLGPVDVGQAVVVQQGIVLAVEAIEGTDAMLRRSGTLKREGQGGVLIKCAKPGQDHRLDLPTIGPATVKEAKAAGLRGIAVSSGSCQILDHEAVNRAIAAAGMFLYGLPGNG
jgi:UDP-2,3-diacylglucosamine hydrolase